MINSLICDSLFNDDLIQGTLQLAYLCSKECRMVMDHRINPDSTWNNSVGDMQVQDLAAASDTTGGVGSEKQKI